MSVTLCVICLGLGAAAGLYRLLWVRRFGWPFPSTVARMAGRVRVAPAADRLELRDGVGTVHLVDLSALSARPALAVGDLVTVDGLTTQLVLAEAPYRSNASRAGLIAVRLVRGSWPRLRGLDLLVCASLVGLGLAGPRLIERSAALQRRAVRQLACPPGTRPGSSDLIEWCEQEREWQLPGGQDAIKHGPWRVWWEPGALRQTGQFVGGRPAGVWTSWHPGGQIQERGAFVNGLKEGTWGSWRPTGTPAPPVLYRDGWRVAAAALTGPIARVPPVAAPVAEPCRTGKGMTGPVGSGWRPGRGLCGDNGRSPRMIPPAR